MKKARYSIKLPCEVGDTIEFTDGDVVFQFVVDKIIIDCEEIRIYEKNSGCVVYAREFDEYCKIIEKNVEVDNRRLRE